MVNPKTTQQAITEAVHMPISSFLSDKILFNLTLSTLQPQTGTNTQENLISSAVPHITKWWSREHAERSNFTISDDTNSKALQAEGSSGLNTKQFLNKSHVEAEILKNFNNTSDQSECRGRDALYQGILTFSSELWEARVAVALLWKPEDVESVERSSQHSKARGSSQTVSWECLGLGSVVFSMRNFWCHTFRAFLSVYCSRAWVKELRQKILR